VLTAQHCVPDAFRVGGIVRLQSAKYNTGGLARTILQIVNHPSKNFDLSVLQITTVTGVQPIPLNSANNLPRPNQPVSVMGFGGLLNAPRHLQRYPDTLQHVVLRHKPARQCRKQHGMSFVAGSEICTYGTFTK